MRLSRHSKIQLGFAVLITLDQRVGGVVVNGLEILAPASHSLARI